MRHLHFTQSLEALRGGGLGTSLMALHRQFLASGIESVAYSTHGGQPQQKEVAAVYEFRRFGPAAIYYAPAIHWNVTRFVKKIDVLHGHGLYVGTNCVFGREARKQDKPLVYHVHGFFEPWILNRSRWKKGLAHWLFEDANFKYVKLWRALTVKEADQIRAMGITAPIVIAPNGLSLADYPDRANSAASIHTPLIPELQKARQRLLFLARIHPKKGLDLLLSAWARLNALRKDWELVIAGPDEHGYMASMLQFAQSLGLENEVTFTGPVLGKVKSALLHSADLFVLPSHSEGFSVSLLEAMACAVPVVATHACNCPDITSAQCGWECDRTVDSLAHALEVALAASPTERNERGSNGRKLVAAKYTWDRVVATLTEACATYC